MKNFLKNNLLNYFPILLLSFICVSIHVLFCNIGPIYKYIISFDNFFELKSILFNIAIFIILTSLAFSILFSLNVFLTKIIIFISNFIGSIYTYYSLHFGFEINDQIIISALFFSESNDIFSSFDFYIFIYVFLLFSISTFAILFCLKKLKIKSKFSLKIKDLRNILIENLAQKVFAIIFLALILCFFLNDIFYTMNRYKTVSEQIMPSYFISRYDLIIMNYKNKNSRKLHDYQDYQFYFEEKNKNPLMVIIVIGESLRSDRLSINGYERQTTPQLEEIDNLFAFKDVLSCSTLTSVSLPCFLTDEVQENWFDRFIISDYKPKHSIAQIFKNLGFYSTLLTTVDKDYGVFMNHNFHNPDTTFLASDLRQNVMSQNNDFSDMMIVEALNDKIEKNLVFVLGTRGSHREYYSNYTRQFAKFKPDIGHSIEHINNSYDNSVFYFDNFLASIVKKFQDKNAILFYVSDHGESLGENGIFLHGAAIKNAPKEQRMVPMIFWMSDQFIKNNKQKYWNLKKAHNLNKIGKNNIKHDHFFHSVLGCAGIKSKLDKIDKNLNLCS